MTTSIEAISTPRIFPPTEQELRGGFPAQCTDSLGVGCSSALNIVEILTEAVADGAMSMDDAQVMLREAAEMARPCQGISKTTLACGCAALREASRELVRWYEATE